MKTQIEIIKQAGRNLILILAALFSFGATFAGNNTISSALITGDATVTSIGDNISPNATILENAKTVHFLEQDATNIKTFHLLSGPTGETNPVVKVYNETGKLVMYQSWTGTFEIEKMQITLPEKSPAGTYDVVITSGPEAWKQLITL